MALHSHKCLPAAAAAASQLPRSDRRRSGLQKGLLITPPDLLCTSLFARSCSWAAQVTDPPAAPPTHVPLQLLPPSRKAEVCSSRHCGRACCRASWPPRAPQTLPSSTTGARRSVPPPQTPTPLCAPSSQLLSTLLPTAHDGIPAGAPPPCNRHQPHRCFRGNRYTFCAGCY